MSEPEQIDIAQARKRFSELSRRASEGEIFVVTRYGKPMARITPPDGVWTPTELTQMDTPTASTPDRRPEQEPLVVRGGETAAERQRRVDEILRGARKRE